MASTTSRTDAGRARALELFSGSRRFLLAGHERPDGDCLGAQAALSSVLGALGKEVTVLNPDPPAPQFAHLTRTTRFGTYQGGPVPEHDVCVLLDINVLERCGALAEPLRRAPSAKVVVDHHPYEGRPWWDAAYVDVTAAATGLLVRRIARELGVELDEAAAWAVFTSLVTDTGWFRYSNTDAETLSVAAETIQRGVRPDELYRALYQQNDQAEPRALCASLDRLEYYAGGRLAVVTMPARGPAAPVDSDALLDILRAVGDVEVVLYLRELEPGRCKLSARSKTAYDVNALARRFGGGGHKKAAGATIEGALDAVERALVQAALAAFPDAPGRDGGGG